MNKFLVQLRKYEPVFGTVYFKYVVAGVTLVLTLNWLFNVLFTSVLVT